MKTRLKDILLILCATLVLTAYARGDSSEFDFDHGDFAFAGSASASGVGYMELTSQGAARFGVPPPPSGFIAVGDSNSSEWILVISTQPIPPLHPGEEGTPATAKWELEFGPVYSHSPNHSYTIDISGAVTPDGMTLVSAGSVSGGTSLPNPAANGSQWIKVVPNLANRPNPDAATNRRHYYEYGYFRWMSPAEIAGVQASGGQVMDGYDVP